MILKKKIKNQGRYIVLLYNRVLKDKISMSQQIPEKACLSNLNDLPLVREKPPTVLKVEIFLFTLREENEKKKDKEIKKRKKEGNDKTYIQTNRE